MSTSTFETVEAVTMDQVVKALRTHGGWASARSLLPVVMKLAYRSPTSEYERDRIREKIRRVCLKGHSNIEGRTWSRPQVYRYRSDQEVELETTVQRIHSELRDTVKETIEDLEIDNATVDRYGSVTIKGLDFLTLAAKLL